MSDLDETAGDEEMVAAGDCDPMRLVRRINELLARNQQADDDPLTSDDDDDECDGAKRRGVPPPPFAPDVAERVVLVADDSFYTGVRRFGIDWSVRHLLEFARAHPGEMVSVGSGCASLEWAAFGSDARCICVDPKLTPGARIAPLAPSVGELVEQRPELVSAATLLCNWCLPNESAYDMEAVELIKPPAVLALIERFHGSYGAAGGERFHTFIEEPAAHGYRVAHRTRLEGDRESAVEWIWLERADQPPRRPALPRRLEAREPCQSGACRIA